jgi:hypothetical protein
MKLVTKGFRLVVTFAVFCLSLVFSCCDEPEPDSCFGQEQIVADFTISEFLDVTKFDSVVVSDTVLTKNSIVFEADTDYVSYQWKIGNDPRTFTTKQVRLSFAAPESDVTIRLVSTWNKNTECFADDDGADTVVKVLTVIDRRLNPIFGKYEGATIANPSDIFTVEITHDEYYDQINLININKGCYPIDESVGLKGFVSDMGYKKILFYSGFYYNSCLNPEGLVRIDASGQNISIDYSIGNGGPSQSETQRISERFIGLKTE